MKKYIAFRLKEIHNSVIFSEFENGELKFKHVSTEELKNNVEDVIEDFYEVMAEDNEVWEVLIEKIKKDVGLIEKINNIDKDKFILEYEHDLCY